MKVEFNLFGTSYSFDMKIESDEDIRRIKGIISDVCNYV